MAGRLVESLKLVDDERGIVHHSGPTDQSRLFGGHYRHAASADVQEAIDRASRALVPDLDRPTARLLIVMMLQSLAHLVWRNGSDPRDFPDTADPSRSKVSEGHRQERFF